MLLSFISMKDYNMCDSNITELSQNIGNLRIRAVGQEVFVEQFKIMEHQYELISVLDKELVDRLIYVAYGCKQAVELAEAVEDAHGKRG